MTTLPVLDPLLHQPIRTQLVAFLAARGEATFSEIKKALEITDGNLGAHLNKLVEADLIGSRPGDGPGRTQTVLFLTPLGHDRLAEYILHLSTLMQMRRSSIDGQIEASPFFPEPQPNHRSK